MSGPIKETTSQAGVYSADQAVGLYPQQTLREIAETFGVTLHRVRRDLITLGVEMKPAGHRIALPNPGRAKISNLIVEQCLSQIDAAMACGVSKRTFQRWMEQAGVETPVRTKQKIHFRKPPGF